MAPGAIAVGPEAGVATVAMAPAVATVEWASTVRLEEPVKSAARVKTEHLPI